MILTSTISFVLGFIAAGIFNAVSYDKGYKDGSDNTYAAFLEEHEKLRRQYNETITNDIHNTSNN